MQALPDEGHQGSATAGGSSPSGLHQDPYRVTFEILGWTEPFAYAKSIESQSCPTEDVGHDWYSFFIDELKLSHQAHLFLIQGGQLNRLFLASRLEAVNLYIGNPPFFLLNATYPGIWEAPYVVKNVVLGKLAQLQDGMDLKSVLHRMAAFHIKNGFRRVA